MTICIPTLTKLLSAALFCLAVQRGTVAAADLPYGHPDFVPSAERPAQLQGDQVQGYPGATPSALQWDWITGENIVWSTVLPSFGFSSPIVVGDQIFLTAEFNLLVCIDAKTGSILWTRDCDSIDQVAGSKAAQVREQWNGYWQTHAEGYAVCLELCFLQYALDLIDATQGGTPFTFPHSKKGKGGGGYMPKDGGKGKGTKWLPEEYVTEQELQEIGKRLAGKSAAEIEAMRQRLAELKRIREEQAYNPSTSAYVPVGSPHERNSPQGDAFKEQWEPIAKELQNDYGLVLEFWNGWLNAFPTPVCDGEHVFAQFFNSQVVCCDLEGKIVWMQVFVDDPKQTGLGLGQNYSASPVLAGPHLVTMFGGHRGSRMVIRCQDKRTGELRWQVEDHDLDSRHSFNQIRRLKTDQVDVIVSGSGLIVDTASGKPLTGLRPFRHQIPPPMIRGDTAYYCAGGGGTGNREFGWYAVRVSAGSDGPQAEFLWAHVPKEMKGKPAQPWSVFSKVLPADRLHDNGNESGCIPRIGGVFLGDHLWLAADGKENQVSIHLATGTAEAHPITGLLRSARHNPDGHLIVAGAHIVSHGTREPGTYSGVFPIGEPSKAVAYNQLGSAVIRRLMLLELPLEDVLQMIRTQHYDPKPNLVAQTTACAQGDRLYIRTRDTLFCIGDPARAYRSPAGR